MAEESVVLSRNVREAIEITLILTYNFDLTDLVECFLSLKKRSFEALF